MLWLAGWFHPRSAEGSTRLYMAGAFAGAVVVLALSIAGWPLLPFASGATDPAAVERNATVGDCLTWTRPDAGDLREVTCGDPHLFEVTGAVDITGQFAIDARFPDQSSWQRVAQSECTSSATAYLGKLDPYGKYAVGALKPTQQQWSGGDRTLHCGLQSATPSGQLLATTGSARNHDQSNVYPVGTCLALDGKTAGGPAPCGTQHAYEIVGVVDLRAQFPNGYPPVDQQQTALAKLCGPLASAYTNGVDLTRFQLTLTWNTIQQQSWDAGSTSANCEIGALLPDGTGLAPVTNSIRGIGQGAPNSTVPTG